MTGLGWSVALAWGSAPGQGCSESLEGSQELVSPGPGVVDTEVEATASGGEAGGDVEEPVAEGFGFGFGQFTVEAEELGPCQQIGGDDRSGEPGLVTDEVFEGEVGQAAVFPGADAVLDSGVLAVSKLKLGNAGGGGVGEVAGVTPALDGVEDAELGARVGAFPPADQPDALSPGR